MAGNDESVLITVVCDALFLQPAQAELEALNHERVAQQWLSLF